jgi:hypothetical protein
MAPEARPCEDDDHASNETPDRSFAEVRAQLATQRGTVENVKDDTGESEGPSEPAAPLRDEAVTRHGFNLHASLSKLRMVAAHAHALAGSAPNSTLR